MDEWPRQLTFSGPSGRKGKEAVFTWKSSANEQYFVPASAAAPRCFLTAP